MKIQKQEALDVLRNWSDGLTLLAFDMTVESANVQVRSPECFLELLDGEFVLRSGDEDSVFETRLALSDVTSWCRVEKRELKPHLLGRFTGLENIILTSSSWRLSIHPSLVDHWDKAESAA